MTNSLSFDKMQAMDTKQARVNASVGKALCENERPSMKGKIKLDVPLIQHLFLH